MRVNKLFTKAMSVVLASAIVVSGVATTSTKKASAKASSYTVAMLFSGSGWQWMADDGAKTKVEKTIKNKKGTQTVTLSQTVKKSKSKKAVKAAQVFVVDVKDILKDHKKKDVKISGVVVKCDGKKVALNAAKLKQGSFEPDSHPNNYRLSVYNEVGSDGDTTHKNPCAKPAKFKYKKSISISFKITIKK